LPDKIKKITRIGLLISLREGYLFCRNLLGLIFHPFKTIKIIYKEKDFSQAALVFGLPFYLLIFGYFSLRATRFLIGAPKSPWGLAAKAAGLFLIIITLISGLYLFYWGWKVINLKSQNSNVKTKSKIHQS
jgi:hypothetical protein